jgi:branched-chain amino acid transport system permease protein
MDPGFPLRCGRDDGIRCSRAELPKRMTTGLLIVQILNGLQFGILLFLVAAGLTLVFGVMDFINLAHGVQYMLGAYLAVTFVSLTGSFVLGLVLALAAALVFGLALEFLVFRHLYERDHLDQVLATFGLILLLNQGVKIIWGAAPSRCRCRNS